MFDIARAILIITVFCLDVTLDFAQSRYMVNESDGSVQVCATLGGQLQREVVAEISLVSGTASSKKHH